MVESVENSKIRLEFDRKPLVRVLEDYAKIPFLGQADEILQSICYDFTCDTQKRDEELH